MTLINDILDLATIEAGYMALEPERIEICDVLEAVAVLTRERARSQNLSLTISCPDDIGAIEADERRLKQALFNLVSNAIKFTPAGGSIQLEARVEGQGSGRSWRPDPGGLRYRRRHRGGDQERMFEKFERGDPYARKSGAGLGLSLVKSLIELHGGSVTIESETGAGTTIACRLPARLRLSAGEEAAAEPPAV